MAMETSRNWPRRSPRSFWGLGLVQLAAYVLLIGSSVVSSRTGAGTLGVACAVCVVLVALLIFWPFRGHLTDRLISLVVGVMSVAIAVLALHGVSLRLRPASSAAAVQGIGGALRPYVHWAVGFVVLLVALTIFGFGRQMLREHRGHLVRALSHSLTSGVAAASAAGWVFLPNVLDNVRMVREGITTTLELAGVLAIALVLVVLLSSASYLWWKESDPDINVPAPWVGFALLPTMFSGTVAYGVGLIILALS